MFHYFPFSSKPFLHFNFGGYEAFLAHISFYSLRKLFLFVGHHFTIGSTTCECYQWLRAKRAITHGYAERDGFIPHAFIMI